MNAWQIQTVQYDNTNSEGNVDPNGYGQIAVLLNKYVLKEKGKGLSSNDFTNTDVQKLNSVEVGSQVNKVETLTINNGSKIYPNQEKNINIIVPTKISQLEDDEGFAKLINASHKLDYSDSYVGKSKISFQDEENIAIGKNSNADAGGVAIGLNTSTTDTYDVNLYNKLKHNINTDLWEGKIDESVTSDIAIKNANNTNLTELDNVINGLSDEITNRVNADTTLQNNINIEVTNRENADDTLQNNINTEITNRENGDTTLQNNIDASNLRITSIENEIPAQASSSNQLADKSFVNSSIQTNTANFRGNWSNWSDVPSDSTLYPQDYGGNTTPTTNDYLVVQDASDYTEEVLSGTWRFKYTGDWDSDGKNGWIPEYQVNEEPFTSEQLYAINSGITANKVSDYDSHLINTSNPHSVTASQVGLGNVTNVATESTITEDSVNNITSGAVYTALADEVSNRNTAISNAINELDVSSVGGSGYYISAISETNGKISATSTIMDFSPTASSNNAVTSDGIRTAIDTAETNAKNLANASGVLGIINGGTSASDAISAEYNIIGTVGTIDTTISDDLYFALRNTTVSSSNGTFRWNKVANIFAYISNKLSGAISNLLTSDLSTNYALISNASGKIDVSSTTSTELGYVHNVTSAIQDQLDAKQPKNLATPLTIEGVVIQTVEGALDALNNKSTSGASVTNHTLYV